MNHLKRPLFELLQHDLSEERISGIVKLIREGPSFKLTAELKSLPVPDQLKHDLWLMGQRQSIDMPPVSDNAAREIFREVCREYLAFNELGTKERRGAIQEFILSVESQIRLAITCDFQEFKTNVMMEEKRKRQMDDQVLLCGRYFAASGIWPVTGIGIEGR